LSAEAKKTPNTNAQYQVCLFESLNEDADPITIQNWHKSLHGVLMIASKAKQSVTILVHEEVTRQRTSLQLDDIIEIDGQQYRSGVKLDADLDQAIQDVVVKEMGVPIDFKK
jgi:hypothetical protein